MLIGNEKNKQIIPLPFPVYFWTVAFLAFSGLADSVYLYISHYRVYTDIAYESFCAISRSINCDTVSQSPYSIFIGIPVPVWGIIGYSFFILFLTFAWHMEAQKQRIWPILFIISLAFSIYSVILAYISTFYIHSYCMMCIVSFGINFLLLYYTWIIRKRFGKSGIIKGLMLDIGFLWEKKKKDHTHFSFNSVYCNILINIFSFLLENVSAGSIEKYSQRDYKRRISMDRSKKTETCNNGIYRLPVLPVQKNAFFS